MDEYSTARRAVMVRLFIDALTKGGPGGVPKPIETYAQDKKRYVGDMLAWLRQFIPIEKEHFLLFLKDCNMKNPGIWRRILGAILGAMDFPKIPISNQKLLVTPLLNVDEREEDFSQEFLYFLPSLLKISAEFL